MDTIGKDNRTDNNSNLINRSNTSDSNDDRIGEVKQKILKMLGKIN